MRHDKIDEEYSHLYPMTEAEATLAYGDPPYPCSECGEMVHYTDAMDRCYECHKERYDRIAEIEDWRERWGCSKDAPYLYGEML